MYIDRLTERQVELCDMLWACETQDELDELFDILYEPERSEAKTLMEIMIHEDLEQRIQQMTSYPDAEKLIKKVLKKY